MDDDFVAVADDIFIGVAAGGPQVAVERIVNVALSGVRKRFVRRPPGRSVGDRSVRQRLEFVHEPERQFPGVGVRRAVAIAAFDLNAGQIGGGQKPIAVNVQGCVTVLAGHPLLVMDVLFHRDVMLGVQRRLLTAVGGIRTVVGRFHQSLKRDTDPLPAVVTRRAGFDRDAGVALVVDGDLRFPGALDRMDQHVPRLIPGHTRVVPLVIAFVAVRDVT